MIISFSPQRRDDSLVVIKAGDVLQINGDVFNFSSLPDGASIPAGEVPCEWIVGPVDRIDGALRVTLVLPHGASPPEYLALPVPIVNPPDGIVSLPGQGE